MATVQRCVKSWGLYTKRRKLRRELLGRDVDSDGDGEAPRPQSPLAAPAERLAQSLTALTSQVGMQVSQAADAARWLKFA